MKSRLQLANGQAQWLINFRLQHLGPLSLIASDLQGSQCTKLLIDEYNAIVARLRDSIQTDYDRQARKERRYPLKQTEDKPVKETTSAYCIGIQLHVWDTTKEAFIRASRIISIKEVSYCVYKVETLRTMYLINFSDNQELLAWRDFLTFVAAELTTDRNNLPWSHNE